MTITSRGGAPLAGIAIIRQGRAWMRAIALAACAVCALGAGSAAAAPAYRSYDDMLADVARKVPAFGGMYIGIDGRLHVYLRRRATNAATASTSSQRGRRKLAKRAKGAIVQTFGANRISVKNLTAVDGKYGFLQLKHWYDRQQKATLSIPGVVLTDIDEAANRITIGVTGNPAAGLVRRALKQRGVPLAATRIIRSRPVEPLATTTLQDTFRPIRAGFQINNGSGSCTLGVSAVRAGVAGFVSNSHCTSTEGGVEGTVISQSAFTGSPNANQIGVETVDPKFVASSSCPSGQVCRHSDSAFFRRDGGTQATARPEVEFGSIQGVFDNTLDVAPLHYRITDESYPVEGQYLYKVGRTTGMTEGKVIRTCATVSQKNKPGKTPNVTLFCQSQVDAASAGGDSGSPVFDFNSASLPPGANPPATLYGLLWGGDGTHFTFSPIDAIEFELGQLKTSPDEGGANSPPEVKIVSPENNANVGFGGLNMVLFKASIADYEGCCAKVSWSSSKDGVIGTSSSFDHTFQSPGTRKVTVTVTDDNGATASDSVTVMASGSAPDVFIKQPTDGQVITQGVQTEFVGSSFDPNESQLALPCSSLTWTSSSGGDPFPVTGCHPLVTFQATGSRTITLTGKDAQGNTAKATVTLSVVAKQSGSAPSVTITKPTAGQVLDQGATYTLKGTAVQSQPPPGPVSYQWELHDGSTTTVLGNGAQIQWKPTGFKCGNPDVQLALIATDANGSGSATKAVTIGTGPC